tara:strand:- start:28492 stop:28716 length:225 start_codon:yes stop_codon:yes gene_type:complete
MSNVDMSRMVTIEDRAAQAEQDAKAQARANALAYLAATDWYVVRLAETGQSVPAKVCVKRDAARKSAGGDGDVE